MGSWDWSPFTQTARRANRGLTATGVRLLLLVPLLGCPEDLDDASSATAADETTGESSDADPSSGDDPSTSTSGAEPQTTGSTSDTTTTSGSTEGDDTVAPSTSEATTVDVSTTTGTTTGDASTTDDGTSTGDTTTSGLPCGDGITDDDEECDPSDPNLIEVAVCSDACKWKGVVVFVTKAGFTGVLGGAAGADQKCRDAAAQASLQNPEKYTAWLSVAENPANARVPLVDKPYYLLSGDAIALDKGGLLSGKLLHAIDMTEYKKSLVEGRRVWTNTTIAGETASWADDCMSFTSSMDQSFAPFGLTNETDAGWTHTTQPEELLWTCFQELRLYCFSGEF